MLKYNETIKNELIDFYQKSGANVLMMKNEEQDGDGNGDDTVDGAEDADEKKTNYGYLLLILYYHIRMNKN